MMNKLISLLIISFIFCQNDGDSLKIDTNIDNKNTAWKLNMFPLGAGIVPLGQFENDKPIKALSIFLMRSYWFNEFREADDIGNLSDRNRSFWWLFFLYLYGIIDAYVDSHIDDVPDVDEDKINNSE